jgi:hypothetical protein
MPLEHARELARLIKRRTNRRTVEFIGRDHYTLFAEVSERVPDAGRCPASRRCERG